MQSIEIGLFSGARKSRSRRCDIVLSMPPILSSQLAWPPDGRHVANILVRKSSARSTAQEGDIPCASEQDAANGMPHAMPRHLIPAGDADR